MKKGCKRLCCCSFPNVTLISAEPIEKIETNPIWLSTSKIFPIWSWKVTHTKFLWKCWPKNNNFVSQFWNANSILQWNGPLLWGYSSSSSTKFLFKWKTTWRSLEDYKLVKDSTIYLILRLVGDWKK